LRDSCEWEVVDQAGASDADSGSDDRWLEGGECDVVEIYPKKPTAKKKRSWHWQRIAPDGTITGESKEDFADEFAAIRGARVEAEGKAELRLVRDETAFTRSASQKRRRGWRRRRSTNPPT
jgi:hypothetical protein